MKIDWKTKLASRKFWCAVTAFVTALLVALNINELTIEQVVAVISALGALVIYIVTEGAVDISRNKGGENND